MDVLREELYKTLTTTGLFPNPSAYESPTARTCPSSPNHITAHHMPSTCLNFPLTMPFVK